MAFTIFRRYFAPASFLVLATSFIALGQAPGTGAISGVVKDTASRAIGNAEVEVVNEATHASRPAFTSEDGVFRVPLLLPGAYTVSVKAGGFAPWNSTHLEVTVSETASLAVTLSVAGSSATVEVNGDTAMVQLESSTLGRAVDRAAIEALPLANRNFTQILDLSPGVVVGLPDATELGRGTQNVTSNGAKTTSNNVQFNGVDANNLSQNSAANDGEEVGVAIPAPDAIEEFKVQTANYDAAYGRGAGANVDLVSRSGSNRFHGGAWEFVRNNLFNANGFFLKQDGQPRPTLKQNQFGASLGGPIRRDKTFFFGEYQGLTSSNGAGSAVTTFLPQLTSDRSAGTLGAQFCPAGHGNAGGYQTNAGGTQVLCDGSNIDPVALALLNFKFRNGNFAVPNPQVLLPSADPNQLPIGQSTYAIPASYKDNQFSVNLDQNFSAKNSLGGRFFFSRAPTIEAFSPNAANVPGWGTNELDENQMFVLSDTHVFSANLINVARFGIMRFDGVSAVANPILASDLGIGTPTGASGASIEAPGIGISGLFTTGDAGTPAQWQNTDSFIWQDMVSHTRGRQNMRFGAEVKRHQVDVDAPFSSSGLLQIATFDDFLLGESAGLLAGQNRSPKGQSNVSQSGGSSGFFRKDERYTDLAFFVQDDVRVSPRLTLNAGVRYEIFGPPTEIHGLLPSFDPGIALGPVPTEGSLSGFTVPANYRGPIPQGVTRTETAGLWSTDFHDVGPRIGFALRLTQSPALLLRGGYGIYYDRPSGGFAESQLGQQPFSVQQLASGAQNGAATLQNPFNPLLPALKSFPIYQPRMAGGGSFTSGVSPHVIDPYTQEYNLNFQLALSREELLEVGYVGSHTTHSPGSVEFNQSLLASPQKPVNLATANTAANVVQRVPYQGIETGSLFNDTDYEANYNSLQASVTRRFAHGLEFLGSYKWSKILDETSGSGGSDVFELWLPTNNQNDPRQAYGLTDFDRDQRAVVSFTWDAPKFRTAPALARDILTDWQFSGIGVVQSGSPITVMDFDAGAVYGNFENRAQRSGAPVSTHGSLYSRVVNGYLTQNAFTIAPEAPYGGGPGDTDFGNSSVGFVRGPGQHNVDMAVERIFPVTESSSFRFRAEFFNLTNTPQFGNPNNDVEFSEGANGPFNGNPAFGQITSTIANPRIIQFAAKFQF